MTTHTNFKLFRFGLFVAARSSRKKMRDCIYYQCDQDGPLGDPTLMEVRNERNGKIMSAKDFYDGKEFS